MDRTSAAVIVVAAGAAIGAQAPINGMLARTTGTLQAATVNFAVGFTLLLLILVVAGGFGGFAEIGNAPWWTLLGGACGVAIVSASIVGVRSIGATGVTAAVVAGQLTASMVIDRFGWFGVDRQEVTATRTAGVLLLIAGVALIVRE